MAANLLVARSRRPATGKPPGPGRGLLEEPVRIAHHVNGHAADLRV
jgi:hypothetical protein